MVYYSVIIECCRLTGTEEVVLLSVSGSSHDLLTEIGTAIRSPSPRLPQWPVGEGTSCGLPR